jgi:dolichol-phosphate mannosyltransferase
MEETLIFVPTYNERENAPLMAAELLRLSLDADVLFIDDNSTDGTGTLLEEIAAKEPRLTVLHRSGKLGIGSAHLAGIDYAYANGYRWLVTLDCDFTHSPSDIPRLLAVRDTAPVVVGSRHIRSGSLPGWSAYRRFMTKLGHFMTKQVLGLPYDASGAFRVYDLTRIPHGLFKRVRALSYHFFFESLFVLHRNGVAVREVDIVLPARTYGHSKMSLRDVVRSAVRILSLGVQSRFSSFRIDLADPSDADDGSQSPHQDWARYWSDKSTSSGRAYDAIAMVYRNAVIRPHLRRAMRGCFPTGSRLLHAGCGSGQVDIGLHHLMRISAVDSSPQAIQLYQRYNHQAKEVLLADIRALPFESGSFDGVYNLGVMEHFETPDIIEILREFHRILKPSGKVLLFWPHARATSAFVLDHVHYWCHSLLNSDIQLHPKEVTRVQSRSAIEPLFEKAGLRIDTYRFGPGDFWVQAVIAASRREDLMP